MKKLILLLAVFVTACGPSVNNSPAVSLPPVVVESTATAYIDPSYPTEQAQVAVPDQAASGIDVHIERASVDGKNVNADVCFTLPDNSDWGIYSASLTYAGNVLQEYGTTLISLQEPANGQAGQRCDTLTFIVAPDADLTNSVITIDAIAATPRDDEYCSVYMPKIQQAMQVRNTGITLDCVDVNGVLTMQITGKPPEMTQEQAEQIIYSPEFYSITGPWVFTFSLSR